jgi:hypothetical protein
MQARFSSSPVSKSPSSSDRATEHLILKTTPAIETESDRLARRSTSEVFEDHLRLRVAGALEEDLRRNYADDVLLLTCNSVLRSRDGIRASARRLREQLPNATFHFTARQVADCYALLVWTADSDSCRVGCGADSFVIRNGKIRVQTVHYDLLDADPTNRRAP